MGQVHLRCVILYAKLHKGAQKSPRPGIFESDDYLLVLQVLMPSKL